MFTKNMPLNYNPLWYAAETLSSELNGIIDSCLMSGIPTDKLRTVSISYRSDYVLIQTAKNFVEIHFDSSGFYALVFNQEYLNEYQRPIRFSSISFSADGLLIQTIN